MNYANEKFPEDLKELIEKCETVLATIENQFSIGTAVVVKELYPEKGKNKKEHILEKLQLDFTSRLGKGSKKEDEVKGLYVFGELDEVGRVIPVYIGISRTVLRRLRQHTWSTNHNECSFAYLKAKHFEKHTKARALLSKNALLLQQEKIKNYRVIVIPEMNDYDLYFMEVYIAGRLKTKWNSFRTH